jgi:hypothetical protein
MIICNSSNVFCGVVVKKENKVVEQSGYNYHKSSRCKVLDNQVAISKCKCHFHMPKCTISISKWAGCDYTTIPWLWCSGSKHRINNPTGREATQMLLNSLFKIVHSHIYDTEHFINTKEKCICTIDIYSILVHIDIIHIYDTAYLRTPAQITIWKRLFREMTVLKYAPQVQPVKKRENKVVEESGYNYHKLSQCKVLNNQVTISKCKYRFHMPKCTISIS